MGKGGKVCAKAHRFRRLKQITPQGFGGRWVILLAGQVMESTAHTAEGLAAEHQTAKPQGQASRGAVTQPQPPTANMGAPFIHNLVSTRGGGSFKPHPCSGTPHGPEK